MTLTKQLFIYISRCLIIYSCCFNAAATSAQDGAPTQSVTYILPGAALLSMAKKVMYKKTPQEDMYLYLLYPDGNFTSPLPAIIYFTGGGWVDGNVADEIPTAAWFRDHGMIGITADYRVRNRHGTTPLEAVNDAKSAMRYVRSHAAELGVDPNRIVAAGGSAGGHLAICTFLTGGDDSADDLRISSKPNALVLHNPVLGERFGLDFLNDHPELTPLKNVTSGWPPTILSCGTRDSTTPYNGALHFQQLMQQAGNTCELITVKDAAHSCDWPVSNPNFLPTLSSMTRFLHHQHFVTDTLQKRWQHYISLQEYMKPFWNTDTIYNEAVQMVAGGGHVQGTLLLRAAKILSVKSSDLQTNYQAGKEWQYVHGKIQLTPNSDIPFFREDELHFSKERPGLSMTGKEKGTFVLFSETNYIIARQIAVTYIAEKKKSWNGPIPAFAKRRLPHTIKKLEDGEPLQIAFLGNSIETGCNSSGFMNHPPYMPSWPELIIYTLREHYKGRVTYTNASVGGKMASWGREAAGSEIAPEKPDLVIIGFGMNDGSAGVSPQNYANEITAMMDSVLAKNSNAEFILIAPMLANPNAIQSGIQASYRPELLKLSSTGVVIADITGVHTELLKHKIYQDMTGNNVNHPNDYLARWYAQFIAGLLIRR